MSGYREGYSEQHSPFYDAGLADGAADQARISSCPPRAPAGPDRHRADSAMYRRGYAAAFNGRVHSCPRCAGE